MPATSVSVARGTATRPPAPATSGLENSSEAGARGVRRHAVRHAAGQARNGHRAERELHPAGHGFRRAIESSAQEQGQEQRKCTEDQERCLDRRRLVLGGDRVLAGGYQQSDVARRHHERLRRLAVDLDLPVRVIRRLDHERRVDRTVHDEREALEADLLREDLAAVRASGRGPTRGHRAVARIVVRDVVLLRGTVAVDPWAVTGEERGLIRDRFPADDIHEFRVPARRGFIERVRTGLLQRLEKVRHREPRRGDHVPDVVQVVLREIAIVEIPDVVGIQRHRLRRGRGTGNPVERQQVVERDVTVMNPGTPRRGQAREDAPGWQGLEGRDDRRQHSRPR